MPVNRGQEPEDQLRPHEIATILRGASIALPDVRLVIQTHDEAIVLTRLNS